LRNSFYLLNSVDSETRMSGVVAAREVSNNTRPAATQRRVWVADAAARGHWCTRIQ